MGLFPPSHILTSSPNWILFSQTFLERFERTQPSIEKVSCHQHQRTSGLGASSVRVAQTPPKLDKGVRIAHRLTQALRDLLLGRGRCARGSNNNAVELQHNLCSVSAPPHTEPTRLHRRSFQAANMCPETTSVRNKLSASRLLEDEMFARLNPAMPLLLITVEICVCVQASAILGRILRE